MGLEIHSETDNLDIHVFCDFMSLNIQVLTAVDGHQGVGRIAACDAGKCIQTQH